MKWLRFFRRNREEEEDTRIYTVDSPREVKPYQPLGRNPSPVRNVPEPSHPLFDDTDQLELAGEEVDEGNPYETSSWKLDPDKGIRRVEDDKTVDRKGRVKTTSNNPYDTGSYRKGW